MDPEGVAAIGPWRVEAGDVAHRPTTCFLLEKGRTVGSLASGLSRCPSEGLQGYQGTGEGVRRLHLTLRQDTTHSHAAESLPRGPCHFHPSLAGLCCE